MLMCLACAAPAPAQPAAPAPLELSLAAFEKIPSLNFSRIMTFAKDDRGFLWVGTTAGLCRFDGYALRLVPIGSSRPGSTLFLEQNSVRAIARMSDGALLLATNRGAWRLDPKTEVSTPFPGEGELSVLRTTGVAAGPDGTVWIGTQENGLYTYDNLRRALRRFTRAEGLSDEHITCLLADSAGIVWIGTVTGGVNALDPATSRIRAYRQESGSGETPSSVHVRALCEAGGGRMWIGTNYGVYRLDPASGRLEPIDLPSPRKHAVPAIANDPMRGTWISVQELGLFFYAGGTLAKVAPAADVERSLSAVTCLYHDSSASRPLLWVGTRGSVNKVTVSRNPFVSSIRDRDSLMLERGAVLSLCEDRAGVLWTGLWGGGLNGFRRSEGRYRRVARFTDAPAGSLALPDNDVSDLLEDRHGNLWIGCLKGLAVLDRERTRMTVYRHSDGDTATLLDDMVNRLLEDRSGNLWISTKRGLSQFVPGPTPSFRHFLHDPAASHPAGGNEVLDILQDREGKIWATTYGRGLMRLGPAGSFTQFTYPEDTSRTMENWINVMTETRDGAFWLGTKAGLVSFDPATGVFTPGHAADLGDAFIFDIVGDTAGALWLSTSNGLVRYVPSANTSVRFDREDGFPFTELFSGFFETRRRTLIVGGRDGFTEFSPEDIVSASRPPGVAITEFSVFDRPLAPARLAAGDIRLSHGENFFSLSFAALDYVNPFRNRFSYRLRGVDPDWVDAGNRNYVRYTHLDPGSYEFQVKACNSDDVWNESGASVLITITPPAWQTWWFRLLALSLIAGAAYAAYRYRLRRVIEVERLRLRIADDLHDDVGSNLSAIAMASRSVQHASGLSSATRQKLAEIYSTAVATSEGMKDIVWFIKPRNDTLDDLLLRMKDTASFLLADVEHEFQAPERDKSVRITIEFKRHFFLAFKEILTNVVKHASATKVQIAVEWRDGVLRTVVCDNGRGFELPPAGSRPRGNGLASLQNRAASIGGVFALASEPAKGTTVTFSGKL